MMRHNRLKNFSHLLISDVDDVFAADAEVARVRWVNSTTKQTKENCLYKHLQIIKFALSMKNICFKTF